MFALAPMDPKGKKLVLEVTEFVVGHVLEEKNRASSLTNSPLRLVVTEKTQPSPPPIHLDCLAEVINQGAQDVDSLLDSSFFNSIPDIFSSSFPEALH